MPISKSLHNKQQLKDHYTLIYTNRSLHENIQIITQQYNNHYAAIYDHMPIFTDRSLHNNIQIITQQ